MQTRDTTPEYKIHSFVLFLTLGLLFSAEQIWAQRFEQIDQETPYIILAQVSSSPVKEVGQTDSCRGYLLVRVVSFLRGEASTDSISLFWGGDSKLPDSEYCPKSGDLVVIYLKSLERNQGTLTRSGSMFPIITKSKSYYTYVVRITSESVVLAWGTTKGRVNSIGRYSYPLGETRIRFGEKNYKQSTKNWIEIAGLQPDRYYDYVVTLGDLTIGEGSVRTYPRESSRVAFFVIGDWGYGSYGQLRLAKAMARLYREKAKTQNPIRFVLTTGDNIYKDKRKRRVKSAVSLGSGDRDNDWEHKFFWPYRDLIKHIPFYPSLGNHDGDESENSKDLEVYLDNFHLPGRYYRFRFAQFAEFYALDSTQNSSPEDGEIYLQGGSQHRWLQDSLKTATREKVPWKIPYYHHPSYNAGPRGKPSKRFNYLGKLLEESGVKVVFNGHEHNFQFSQLAGPNGLIRFVVTGGAGKPASDADLRSRSDFKGNNLDSHRIKKGEIAYWSDQFHFLHVEIIGTEMEIKVLGIEGRIKLQDEEGREVKNLPKVSFGSNLVSTTR